MDTDEVIIARETRDTLARLKPRERKLLRERVDGWCADDYFPLRGVDIPIEELTKQLEEFSKKMEILVGGYYTNFSIRYTDRDSFVVMGEREETDSEFSARVRDIEQKVIEMVRLKYELKSELNAIKSPAGYIGLKNGVN